LKKKEGGDRFQSAVTRRKEFGFQWRWDQGDAEMFVGEDIPVGEGGGGC